MMANCFISLTRFGKDMEKTQGIRCERKLPEDMMSDTAESIPCSSCTLQGHFRDEPYLSSCSTVNKSHRMFLLDLSPVPYTETTKDAKRGLFFKTVSGCSIKEKISGNGRVFEPGRASTISKIGWLHAEPGYRKSL